LPARSKTRHFFLVIGTRGFESERELGVIST